MSYPLVLDLAAGGTPVTVTCRVLNIARQLYYRWLAHPVTDADLLEAHRANALFDAHHDDPEFGYRLLADEARDAGQVMAERTAWRICAANRWWSTFGKRLGRNGKKPGPPVHDDRCAVTDEKGRTRHEFKAEAANQLRIGFRAPRGVREPWWRWETATAFLSQQGCGSWRTAGCPGVRVVGGAVLDNDGSFQHCRMGRARLARRRGIRIGTSG